MNTLSIELAEATILTGNMTFNGKVTLLDAEGNKIAEGTAIQIQFSDESGGGFTSYHGVPDLGLGELPPMLEPPGAYNGDNVLGLLRTLIPGIDAMTARCPVDYCDNGVAKADWSVPDVVIHLNDAHKMSREQIAGWLDTLPYDLTLGQEPKAHVPAGSATATVLASPGLVNFSGEEVCAPSYDYTKILLCSCGWSTSTKATGELARTKELNDHIEKGNQG